MENIEWYLSLPNSEASQEAMAEGYQAERMGMLRGLADKLLDESTMPPIIHVAGTRGKGSTILFAESLMNFIGKETVSYMSPGRGSWQNRLRRNGRALQENEINDLLGDMRRRASNVGVTEKTNFLTRFEIMTLAALFWFQESGADIALLETGVGGRWDATNLLKEPAACVVTALGTDHAGLLGPSLRDIARHKFGIAKKGVPLVLGPQPPEALEYASEEARLTCEEVGAPLLVVQVEEILDQLPNFNRDNWPRHQLENLATGVSTLELVYPDLFDILSEKAGEFAHVFDAPGLECRLEVRQEDPLIILDAAHDVLSMRAAVVELNWRPEWRDKRWCAAMSLYRDKDAEGIFRELAKLRGLDKLYLFRAPADRSTETAELRLIAEQVLATRSGAVEILELGDLAACRDEAGLAAGSSRALLVTGGFATCAAWEEIEK